MTIAVKLLLTVALIFSIAVPFGAFAAGEKTKGRYKTALAANTVMFFGTMLFAVCVLFWALHSQPSPQLQPAASPPVWATSQLLFPLDFPVSAAALPFPRQHPQHLALSVRIPPFLVNLLSS